MAMLLGVASLTGTLAAAPAMAQTGIVSNTGISRNESVKQGSVTLTKHDGTPNSLAAYISGKGGYTLSWKGVKTGAKLESLQIGPASSVKNGKLTTVTYTGKADKNGPITVTDKKSGKTVKTVTLSSTDVIVYKGDGGVTVSGDVTLPDTTDKPDVTDPLAKFSTAERKYLETQFFVYPSQKETTKPFDGWSPSKLVYTKVPVKDLQNIQHQAPGYSAQDAEKLFHYTIAGEDQGGALISTYYKGVKTRAGEQFDTKTITYTGRESGATVTYVWTSLDKPNTGTSDQTKPDETKPDTNKPSTTIKPGVNGTLSKNEQTVFNTIKPQLEQITSLSAFKFNAGTYEYKVSVKDFTNLTTVTNSVDAALKSAKAPFTVDKTSGYVDANGTTVDGPAKAAAYRLIVKGSESGATITYLFTKAESNEKPTPDEKPTTVTYTKYVIDLAAQNNRDARTIYASASGKAPAPFFTSKTAALAVITPGAYRLTYTASRSDDHAPALHGSFYEQSTVTSDGYISSDKTNGRDVTIVSPEFQTMFPDYKQSQDYVFKEGSFLTEVATTGTLTLTPLDQTGKPVANAETVTVGNPTTGTPDTNKVKPDDQLKPDASVSNPKSGLASTGATVLQVSLAAGLIAMTGAGVMVARHRMRDDD